MINVKMNTVVFIAYSPYVKVCLLRIKGDLIIGIQQDNRLLVVLIIKTGRILSYAN